MDTPQPFRIDVPQPDLDELFSRLERTRWPDQLPGVGWSYGVELTYLQELVDYWCIEYDWRLHERRLNELTQFTTRIDGQQIHFLHVRSPHPDATPLIITHGWPSTVYDFVDIIGPLTDPLTFGGDRSDAFHVVAPSLPGFAFSGMTNEPGWGTERIARVWSDLMEGLGYTSYGAQGGDFGALVAPELGRVAPDRVIGVHLNALPNAAVATAPGDQEVLTDAEREITDRNEWEWMERSGYAIQMSTRPQTIAYALNDSPTGQLAWNLEWFVDFDPESTDQDPVDRDALLTDVTIFWLTRTAGSAARLYREAGESWGSRPEPSGVPTAVANFRGDGAIRSLAERSNRITRWSDYDAGGHFASLQAPGLLVSDIRAFFRELRTEADTSAGPQD